MKDKPSKIIEDGPRHHLMTVTLLAGLALVVINVIASTVAPNLVDRITDLVAPVSSTIPQHATADQYLHTAIEFKAKGWTEKARICLNKAIELDKGEIGNEARRFLNTKIPVHKVSRAAEQGNIEGYNLMVSNQPEEAKKVFLQLIHDYPEFEWPYNNLAGLYIDAGDSLMAEKYSARALKINPHYVNALMNLVQAKLMQKDIPGARKYLDKLLLEEPDNDWAISKHKELEAINLQ